MTAPTVESFAENFDANREILRKFKINSNVVITNSEDKHSPWLGSVIGYDTFDNDGRISLMVRIITYSRLRESDIMPVWEVDPTQTKVELV